MRVYEGATGGRRKAEGGRRKGNDEIGHMSHALPVEAIAKAGRTTNGRGAQVQGLKNRFLLKNHECAYG